MAAAISFDLRVVSWNIWNPADDCITQYVAHVKGFSDKMTAANIRKLRDVFEDSLFNQKPLSTTDATLQKAKKLTGLDFEVAKKAVTKQDLESSVTAAVVWDVWNPAEKLSKKHVVHIKGALNKMTGANLKILENAFAHSLFCWHGIHAQSAPESRKRWRQESDDTMRIAYLITGLVLRDKDA